MFDNKGKAAKRTLHSCVRYGAAQRIAHLSFFFFLNFSPTMLSRLLILVVVATTAKREEKERRMT